MEPLPEVSNCEKVIKLFPCMYPDLFLILLFVADLNGSFLNVEFGHAFQSKHISESSVLFIGAIDTAF